MPARFGRHRIPPTASNPDLWPFDLETGMRAASKVGNPPSKLWHARPLCSVVIRYVGDGRTDRQTDWQKQHLLPPSLELQGIIIQQHVWLASQKTTSLVTIVMTGSSLQLYYTWPIEVIDKRETVSETVSTVYTRRTKTVEHTSLTL